MKRFLLPRQVQRVASFQVIFQFKACTANYKKVLTILNMWYFILTALDFSKVLKYYKLLAPYILALLLEVEQLFGHFLTKKEDGHLKIRNLRKPV